MKGYPKVDRDNDFLLGRFDGSVFDALPWGRDVLLDGEAEEGGKEPHLISRLKMDSASTVSDITCSYPSLSPRFRLSSCLLGVA